MDIKKEDPPEEPDSIWLKDKRKEEDKALLGLIFLICIFISLWARGKLKIVNIAGYHFVTFL